jgi:hypothetical protein
MSPTTKKALKNQEVAKTTVSAIEASAGLDFREDGRSDQSKVQEIAKLLKDSPNAQLYADFLSKNPDIAKDLAALLRDPSAINQNVFRTCMTCPVLSELARENKSEFARIALSLLTTGQATISNRLNPQGDIVVTLDKATIDACIAEGRSGKIDSRSIINAVMQTFAMQLAAQSMDSNAKYNFSSDTISSMGLTYPGLGKAHVDALREALLGKITKTLSFDQVGERGLTSAILARSSQGKTTQVAIDWIQNAQAGKNVGHSLTVIPRDAITVIPVGYTYFINSMNETAEMIQKDMRVTIQRPVSTLEL